MRFCKKEKSLEIKASKPDERDYALEQSVRDLEEVKKRIELIKQNLKLVSRGEDSG